MAAPEHSLKYSKVYTLGDPKVRDLFSTGSVCIQEKVDGSQFRFGVIDGKLVMGSHRVDFNEAHPPGAAFAPAVKYIESIQAKLEPGLMYFAEFLAKPRQNAITYGTTPTNGLMLFDVYKTDTGEWDSPSGVQEMAASLGIDGPRILGEYSADAPSFSLPTQDQLQLLLQTQFQLLLQTQSYLGGSLIEGIVIKNYALKCADPYHSYAPMTAKYVRPSFKEEKSAGWKEAPDAVSRVVARFKTTARWEKAVQHLREDSKLEGSARDIKPLLDEVWRDIEEEAKDEILEMLWKDAKADIRQGVTRGLPQWWKEKLAGEQFAPSEKT